MRELTLVTVHYNTAEITIHCLQSILRHLPGDIDAALVVVDNASQKEELVQLEEFVKNSDDDRLHLRKSRVNTGFGWGNMMGVQEFPARYYLFINNDTLVREDVFSPCLSFLRTQEDAGMCGIQIEDPEGRRQVSFDHFATPLRELLGSGLLEKIHPGKPLRKASYSQAIPVDYVNGSFMFVRAEDFEQAGGFDPHIFLYYEESDLCLRLLRAGKKTYFLPGLSYTHIQNASVKKTATGTIKKIELKRSYLYLTRKHYGLLAHSGMWMYFVLRYGLQSLVKPKYLALLGYLLRGAPLHETLRLKQRLTPGV